MTDDGHAHDLVGAYAMGACPPDEARSVAEHASHCPMCAAEIAELSQVVEWIGMTTATAPTPELRSRMLSAALAVRPAGRPSLGPVSVALHATADAQPHVGQVDVGADIHRLVDPYRVQIVELDRLLSGLSQQQWMLPTGPHRSVRDLIVHLRGSDEPIAAAAGIDTSVVPDRHSTSDIQLGWRGQADAIIDVVARSGFRLLQRQVRLAGRAEVRSPVREALIQRGFETWIHAEDIRAALRLPSQTPSAHQTTEIVNFAVRLLPAAMDAAGRAHPHQAVRLVLAGAGGGTRLVDLSATTPTPGTVVAELSLPAERFCRLLAGRLAISSTNTEVDGDFTAADDFLTVAATMGCD